MTIVILEDQAFCIALCGDREAMSKGNPGKIKMDLWELPPIDPQKINPANGLLREVTGSRGGIRTPDMVVNSHPLCQLSYPGYYRQISLYIIKNTP